MTTPSSLKRPLKAEAPGVVNALVKKPGSSRKSRSASNVIAVIERGLPIRELDDLQKSLDVDLGRLAALLGMSKATLHRRKAEGRLGALESDRLLRFARLMGKAVGVFGGLDAAREWLRSAQIGLGGTTPLDYARTEVGAREVEDLLGRIEYGIYS
jgi:putative toxin-antitoxin system antitoxin component (TIGR02293 family)